MYSKFRNRVMFPISSEAGQSHRLHRTHAVDRRKGWTEISELTRDADLLEEPVLFNLDLAKEWIKKFDYAILVEGQMDCISVYAAGFHNVIASSGTAFTELQAKLLGALQQECCREF